jgi:hypothetical protein
MKYSILILIFCYFVGKAQTGAFSHKFEITVEECGGAASSEGGSTLASQNKKKPFANQTIYMYKKGKCVDSLITDSAGWVNKRIKFGKYDLYLPYKHFKRAPIKTEKDFDMECMKKEWARPDGKIDMSWKGTKFLNQGIGFKKCDWRYNCLKDRRIPVGGQG